MLKRRLTPALFALGLLLPASASAQPAPDPQAEALNEEGKQLFKEKRYLEAYKRFEKAAQISPDPRYYFNVCFSLNYLERYEEAIAACEKVGPAGADADLLAKTDKVLAALRQKVPAGGEVPPGGNPGGEPGGDPGAEPPPAGDPAQPPAGYPPPAGADPFAMKEATPGAYEWSVGGELGVVANGNLGKRDGMRVHDGGFHMRLYSNFLVDGERGLGAQGYFNLSDLSPADSDSLEDRLRIYDFGVAAFWQRPLFAGFYYVPRVGVHASLQQPDVSSTDVGLAFGLRGEFALAYAFGPVEEHAVTFTPAINLYSRVFGDPAFPVADAGLDHGSATIGLTVGYQYRFSTPFGATPLFTLE